MLSWIGSRAGSSCGSRRAFAQRRFTRRPSTRPRCRNRAGGFTLLEVIVAFTILSVALVGLLQAFATGMRGLGAAQASAAAVLHARSKLDEVGLSIALRDDEMSGEFDDGHVWRTRIARVDAGPADEQVEPIAVAFEVEVEVSGPRGGAVKLTTLRLGSPK